MNLGLGFGVCVCAFDLFLFVGAVLFFFGLCLFCGFGCVALRRVALGCVVLRSVFGVVGFVFVVAGLVF